MRAAALDEIRKGLEELVLPVAQARCPKDSGLTAESGAVDELEGGKGVQISFKSDVRFDTEQWGEVDLAFWLHENFSYTPRVAGTGPKYLEIPFAENSPEILARVEARLQTIG